MNESRYLGQLLDAISAQCVPRHLVQTIVVDSGSIDDTCSLAEAAGCVILHLPRSEFSFGRSLNIGCEAATGQVLVFISGHCVPTDNLWLSQLLSPFEDPAVSIAYGRQVGGEQTKFSEHSVFEKYFPQNGQNGSCPYFCNNANAALNQSCWEEFRFDESLTGLEDMYLAKQLFQKGKKIVYVPQSCVYHYHHETWTQVKRRYEREAIALREIMPEVHVHWLDALRYFTVGVLGDYSRALQERRFIKSASEIVAFRFCQFYGAWRGNHAHRDLSRQQKERYFFPK